MKISKNRGYDQFRFLLHFSTSIFFEISGQFSNSNFYSILTPPQFFFFKKSFQFIFFKNGLSYTDNPRNRKIFSISFDLVEQQAKNRIKYRKLLHASAKRAMQRKVTVLRLTQISHPGALAKSFVLVVPSEELTYVRCPAFWPAGVRCRNFVRPTSGRLS